MIIFDTETTGLIQNIAIPLAKQPSIIELYALKIDDKTLEVVDYWHSMFWAKEVPEEVVKITGIKTEDLIDAPKFAQVVDSLSDYFLGERWICGHNLSFDRDMLLVELRRLGRVCNFPWPYRHLCTVEATEHLEGFRQSLTNLHTLLFGEGFDAAHRAESDVQATARCVRKLIENGVIKL